MLRRLCLTHPTVLCCAYLAVPVAVDLLAAAGMLVSDLRFDAVAVQFPGFMILTHWRWGGLGLCILTGFALGFPVARLQVAYIRAQMSDPDSISGDDLLRRLDCFAIMVLPWFLAIAAGHLLGYALTGPSIAPPLVGCNVLLARAFVHSAHIEAYSAARARRRTLREPAAAERQALPGAALRQL